MSTTFYIWDTKEEKTIESGDEWGLTSDEAVKWLRDYETTNGISYIDSDWPSIYAVSHQEAYGWPIEYLFHDSVLTEKNPSSADTVYIWDEIKKLLTGVSLSRMEDGAE